MGRLALIGGTGAGLYPQGQAAELVELPAGSWGAPSAVPRAWQVGAHELLFLPRHGVDGRIPPHRVNYRANIDLLATWSPDAVVAMNAVGAIEAQYDFGGLVVPEQLIDYTYGRAHTYFDDRRSETEYIDFTNPYDDKIRLSLIKAAAAGEIPLSGEGTCGITQGPRLETAAEIDRLERDGCTLVGMTGMPEAALARERGLPYASLCLVVNAAAGRGDQPIHADIGRHLQTALTAAHRLIERWLTADRLR